MTMGGGLERRVEAVRRFNRFYTRQIGVLQEGLSQSPFSLTEARVLYEVAHREGVTATELGGELALDAGYLSRILRGLRRRGLVLAEASASDRRRKLLRLTAAGASAFALLDAASREDIRMLLGDLAAEQQERLVASMRSIETVLGAGPEGGVPYVLRPPEPGDLGWVVQRHGALYAREYGWDETFEALVARIVADYVEHLDARRERCWIAEREGENVGSVFLVKKSETVAKLRLLLVEPGARGLGIGRRLVEECVRHARRAGYQRITLWTNSVLTAARHIYEAVGFERVAEEAHHSFGHDLVSETWEMEL